MDSAVPSADNIWRQWLAWCESNSTRLPQAGRLTDHIPSGDHSGPFPAFESSWEQLPPELHYRIYGFLANSDIRADISRLSLVSHAWSRQFRPRLFTSLKLNSGEDCHILYGILRSPLSAWLAEHVTKLRFGDTCFPDPHLWMTLVRLLPACRGIDTRYQRQFTPNIIPRRISYSAELKSSLRNITTLKLDNCEFPSLRILLRTLGDITFLEAVHFRNVTWSGDPLLTIDIASNISNGTFRHVRSIILWYCTSGVAVPAWILAAAGTRHSFSRRQTIDLAVPAETWAIIKFMRMFFCDITLRDSLFHVTEATPGEFCSSYRWFVVLMRYSQDNYKFIGSLRAGPSSNGILRTCAYISVQIVRAGTTPSSNGAGNETWSVSDIALADSGDELQFDYFYHDSCDWSAVTSLLPVLPRLHQFQVLCGKGYSEAHFHALSAKVMEAVNIHPTVTVQYDPSMPDGRFLQPTFFDLDEADLMAAQ
ncbi:uncharacterized protein PHACADRAFT_89734 [Phanerochaete carnosa HHB-10118-sp]|uniref:F-box domain-containing protein n=1 Tax=Phanerochaete carnosa (strain HHB-10118-sp) TaxID=650164 RepID=K5W401_PHACS|nr:uncharacterized protein PHACADRAFT_89734 [Phanerochaete carnosa HHB-10118-sp]EKM58623.1 hypothetical protein PHACADRAFT_89734 [Phanerochaete carnosa HHB-10118-sp]